MRAGFGMPEVGGDQLRNRTWCTRASMVGKDCESMETRKSWGIIGVRDWDLSPSQVLHSNHKVGQYCEE